MHHGTNIIPYKLDSPSSILQTHPLDFPQTDYGSSRSDERQQINERQMYGFNLINYCIYHDNLYIINHILL